LFLIEMVQVVPWKGLIPLIGPHYPKGEGGRPAYGEARAPDLELVGYSDPVT